MPPQSGPQTSAPRIPPTQLIADATVERTGGREAREGPRSDAVIHEPRQGARSGVIVKGRDGKPLSRGKVGTGDSFEIPPEIVPRGWRYQWNVISVTGNADVARRHNLTMYAQGWRPVPADRHPGMFMPLEYNGPIEIEGMRLDERPEELCAEAEAEDYARAYGQVKDTQNSLMGRKANLENSVHPDFKLNPRTQYKGRRTQMGIDEAYDIPTPTYQPPDDSAP